MNRKHLALCALLGAVPGWLAWLLLAALLASCFQGERVAGSSTEAGNATGKLSQADGSPAAGVSVALVARTYVPDTSGGTAGDKAGAYYRTRTDAEGNFAFTDVAPGTYRVMAVGQGAGSLTDSVVVGPDTARVEQVLKPLGALQGAVKLVGTDARVNLWVSPVATLKDPPRADSAGGFRLDSLPEGEYELMPLCYECAPVEKPYRVRVRSGEETVLPDTLKLYPGYFRGFPDSGGFEVRATDLPVKVTGKTSRGDKDEVRPRGATWSWNGQPVPADEVTGPDGILETSVRLDSALLGTADSGNLQVTLAFPDTQVSRIWRVKVDRSAEIWQARLVEADSVIPIPGPGPDAVPRWRVKVAATRHLEPADLAWWGLSDQVVEPRPGSLPTWISLGAQVGDAARIGAREGRLTFVILPDARLGGRIFRPRRDERLEDFASIRRFDAAKLGFRDSLVPAMLPGGLILDRFRGPNRLQRYRVDAAGAVTELLDFAALPGWDAGRPEPLLFWRTGRAGAGFAWNGPARDAASLLAVTREGLAYQPGSNRAPISLPPPEMAALDSLLGSLSADPPALPDTADLDSAKALAYLRYGRRGLLLDEASVDSLLPALRAWLVRNGLSGSDAYPLGSARREFLSFALESGVRRYTGDTLRLVLTASRGGADVEESLSPGSPSRLAGDTLVLRYRLVQEGDTLIASSGDTDPSRLFGSIGPRLPLFAVAGLRTITATLQDGLPVLSGGGNILAGRLEGDLVGWGDALVSPGLLLDGRGIGSGSQGRGYLFTLEAGLELAWRFGGRSGAITGWDLQ